MAMKFSEDVRNARLDAIQEIVGPSPILRFWSGSTPANTSAPDAGTKLVEMNLPANWMSPAANASKQKAGVWKTLSALATGVAMYYRIYSSDDDEPRVQGTITATGDGGDMTVASTDVFVGQEVVVTAFSINEGNG